MKFKSMIRTKIITSLRNIVLCDQAYTESQRRRAARALATDNLDFMLKTYKKIIKEMDR